MHFGTNEYKDIQGSFEKGGGYVPVQERLRKLDVRDDSGTFRAKLLSLAYRQSSRLLIKQFRGRQALSPDPCPTRGQLFFALNVVPHRGAAD